MSDSSYAVSRTTYNCRAELSSVEHNHVCVSRHKHVALLPDKVGIFIHRLSTAILSFSVKISILQTPFYSKKIPSGLQVVVMVDDQGKLSINDLEQSTPIIVSNVTVHGNARVFLEGLSQQDGFRSLILEAIYDGENLYVTDGSYIHDTDLTGMPFEKRYETLSKFMDKTKNNQVCGLIEAQTLAPEKWGGTARNGIVKALLARRKSDVCSLHKTSKGSASAIIIGEREPTYYDCVKVEGNTGTLREPESKQSTYITYPFQDNRMMLKSLNVIGPVNTTDLAFMF